MSFTYYGERLANVHVCVSLSFSQQVLPSRLLRFRLSRKLNFCLLTEGIYHFSFEGELFLCAFLAIIARRRGDNNSSKFEVRLIIIYLLFSLLSFSLSLSLARSPSIFRALLSYAWLLTGRREFHEGRSKKSHLNVSVMWA
jgi:hypothetical protein